MGDKTDFLRLGHKLGSQKGNKGGYNFISGYVIPTLVIAILLYREWGILEISDFTIWTSMLKY